MDSEEDVNDENNTFKDNKTIYSRNPSEKENLRVSENRTDSFSTFETPKVENILFRMSKIVDKLAEQEHFKKVDKSSLMQRLAILAGKYPEVISLTNDELAQRIERIMVIELVAGMLQDLTPEEMKSFDEAVKRRGSFNELYLGYQHSNGSHEK